MQQHRIISIADVKIKSIEWKNQEIFKVNTKRSVQQSIIPVSLSILM